MKFRHLLALLPAFTLTACNGGNENDAQTLKETEGAPGSVVYSYPADGQSAVSTRADLVLRFSHALSETEDSLKEKIQVKTGDETVSFSVTKVDSGHSLKLTPQEQLTPASDYTLSFAEQLQAGNRLIPNPNATGPEGIQFSTRGALSGNTQAQSLDDEFRVASMIPAEGSPFLPVDFSTFRLQLTQPVHPEWQAMGGSIRLLDSNNEPVPATVLARGRAITVDPCIADSPQGCGKDTDLLDPQETYTLTIQDLPGQFGGTLDYSAEVTPRDTAPDASRTTLYQRIIDSGLNAGASEEDAERSILNGQIINGITLKSVLQGEAGPSQQTADLFAQLAYAPAFDGDIGVPLRISRNSRLSSSSLDIRINGIVPVIDESTGGLQSTGDINVTMLSDASGYLLPNPFSRSASAPRHVRLWMDIAMSTEKAMPNAALSQDVMGLELTGIAQVQDGILTIDAIGIVEPRLLGLEDTQATIAFRIEADTDADVQLEAEANREQDTSGPELVSWMPGPEDGTLRNRQSLQRPDDPVILFYNEPLDPDTVSSGISLISGGTEYSVANGNLSLSTDGTTLTALPEGGLQYGATYSLNIDGSIQDLSGNPVTPRTLEFSMVESAESATAPIVMSTYPGFPCVTEQADTASGSHGFCVDSPSANGDVDRPSGQPREELFITDLPADRPITVSFSRPMRLDSLNDNTFIVEKIVEGSATRVTGRFEKFNQKIRFYPDQNWEEGELYRYTLKSAMPTEQASSPSCPAGSEPSYICGANDLALNTDILVDPEDVGGPDLEIYFHGSEPMRSVLNPLRTLPTRDVNANLQLDCQDSEGNFTPGARDCAEPFPLAESAALPDGTFPTPENAAQLAFRSEEVASEFIAQEITGRIGCPPESAEECPENQFLYQNLHLNTEIIGATTDPETGKPAIKVLLYPSIIVTTPVDVYLSDPLGKQPIGPQILRMRYSSSSSCTGDCPRNAAIEGYIVRDDQGVPNFRSDVQLLLDAPNLQPSAFGGPLVDTQHNLFSYPLALDLDGDIRFFSDGRMQIGQNNREGNSPISAQVTYSGSGSPVLLAGLDLELPAAGVLLNLISNPMKEEPQEQ